MVFLPLEVNVRTTSVSGHDDFLPNPCNLSSAWLFRGPEFEPRTPLHHCAFSGMPVYFWEQVGSCSQDVEALSQGVAVRRDNT
jgi:hypothetical protein